jgi:hypothetical protein
VISPYFNYIELESGYITVLGMTSLSLMQSHLYLPWQVKAGEEESSGATGVPGLDIMDPHLMRLGDWLAEQHGEERMASLEEEGVTQWDLEGWQMAEACEQLSVVFIKDPQGQVWPYVKEHQAVQKKHIQVIAQSLCSP